MKNNIILLLITLLFGCGNKNEIKSILGKNVRYRGTVLSGEYVNYDFNNILKTNWVDTFPKNILLSDFLTNNKKNGEIKIIDTEKISIPYTTILNNVEVCCNYDTTSIFSEVINNKSYLFIPHYFKGKEWYNTTSYNTIFEIGNVHLPYNKQRKNIDLPMWGLRIGDYINKNEIDSSIQIRSDDEGGNIRTQFLKSDKSILLSTLEFENSNKLLITHIEKTDLSETEFNDFINFIKSKFKFLNIEEETEIGSFTHTTYSINYYGLNIIFNFSDVNLTYSNIKNYTFKISDNYITSKRIIENEGKKFIYNEGNKFLNKQ